MVSPSRETVNKGDDATFTCSVYGDDENDDVTITWSREYSQLEDIRVSDTKHKFYCILLQDLIGNFSTIK